MKKKEKILVEVERTLGSLDNISDLKPNPFLFTRIKAQIEKDNITPIENRERIPVINPIILTIILILNIITVVFLFQSGGSSHNNQSTLVNSLKYDYQFTQTKYDIFKTE